MHTHKKYRPYPALELDQITWAEQGETTNDWDAGAYNQHAAFVSQLALPVVELLAPKCGEKILDLGCGEGTLAVEIAKSGAEVIGIDSSAEMVRAAGGRGIEAHVMSATELSYAGCFDAVFSNAALHWIKESDAVVANVYKALKTGGRFVAEFGGFGNAERVVEAMAEVFRQNPGFGPFESPWYFPTVDEYRALLEASGFRVESVELIPRPTPVDDIANWLDLFANGIVSHLSGAQQTKFKEEVRTLLKPKLFDERTGWCVDYVRLRVKAKKENAQGLTEKLLRP